MTTRRGKQPAGLAEAAAAEAAPSLEAFDVEPAPADMALSELLAQLGGAKNASISVYRYKKNEPLVWLFDCVPEAFSKEQLRDKYNGGQFKLYIAYDGSLKKAPILSIEPPAVLAPATPPASTDVVLALREGLEKQAQMIRELKAQPAAPQLDLPSLIASATQMITALRQAAEPTRPAPAPAPPPAPTASLDAMIELLKKGIDLGRTVTPGEGGGAAADEGGIMGLVKGLMPILQPILDQVKAAATPAPAPQRVYPAPPGGQPAPAAVVAGGPMMQDQAKHYVAQLLDKARRNLDPTVYGQVILDMVPEGQLRVWLQQPNVLEQLATINPEVATYRAWFAALVAWLCEVLELPPPDLTPPGAGGNGTSDAARPDAANVPRSTT
jgi:hypothetical protein